MYFTRKSMSEASKTIFKEQRELTKERILGNPALIIGTFRQSDAISTRF